MDKVRSHLAPPATLIELLRERSARGDARAYTFLAEEEREPIRVSCAELETGTRAIAAALQERQAAGERVLLLYPPGPDFLAAVWGCIFAGAIAVPCFPARLSRQAERLSGIARDAQASVVLTERRPYARSEELRRRAPDLGKLFWLSTDNLSPEWAERWRPPDVHAGTTALLQYTSGSTDKPKGVMVSHGNLLHNLSCIQRAFAVTRESVVLTWLPPYHDMGLIGGLLTPLYAGCAAFVMPPSAFLERPVRWLEEVTSHRATTIVAPNFAYDLCVRKITAEERSLLDLKSVVTAVNAAETVQHATLEKFAASFAACGFRREAFYPAYGLAEATLFVCGARKPAVFHAQAGPLQKGMAAEARDRDSASRALVGCGATADGMKVIVADPETRKPVPSDHVGEIWVSGPSVAQGYWGRAGESEETFAARLSGSEEGPFLRTGDLGFLRDGVLFITGRIKDLVIVRGRNHHAEDLELSVGSSHPFLRSGCGAAFAIDGAAGERLVVVHEVEKNDGFDGNKVVSAIRRKLSDVHEILPCAVVLIRAGSLPRTSSGKIQRHVCKAAFSEGTLKVVYEWRAKRAPGAAASAATVRSGLLWDFLSPQSPVPRSSDAAGVGISRLSRSAHSRNGHKKKDACEPIAVVGMACRFPRIDDLEAFWRVLREGEDTTAEVPASRWDVEEFYHPVIGTPGKMNTRWGGFIDKVDLFDPFFFGIAMREACHMDPQQRLLLEVAWEALEHGGQAAEKLSGSRTGVFVGIAGDDYARMMTLAEGEEAMSAYVASGNAHSIAANRLSYLLDLRGPSLAVDTACSSSLVAVHLACESLRSGESDMALAGGVNLILSPDVTVAFSHAHMMSSDGRCKPFDAAANGYVRAEGCALVVLKRLSDAQRNHDNVLAVIRGSAVNQDGRTAGIAVPNGTAQEAVIHQALRQAGVATRQIGYVEAHGTGTSVGDPIEAGAIKTVLGRADGVSTPCFMGSIKANIGHSETASGIAGLLKAILCLRHGEIPRQIHFHQLNPGISLESTRITIPRRLEPWPEKLSPRLAGVNSFGFGGTNAHVVVEGPRPATSRRSGAERPQHVLTLSAKSESALTEVVRRFKDHLAAASAGESVADVCFTASTGRSHFPFRLAAVGGSALEMREKLEAFLQGKRITGLQSGQALRKQNHRIAFLFTGQGSQYPGMARQLYETQPTFYKTLNYCDQVLRPHMDRPLLSVLYPRTGEHPVLDETAYVQPALFALEYALAEMWRSWGIVPDAVLGHSLGEYAAACVAGVFSLEEGLKFMAERGRLMQSLSLGGEMAMIFAAEKQVASAMAAFHERVSIAGVNGPEITVISGARDEVRALVQALESRGMRTQRLDSTQPFHSPMVEPVLAAFEECAGRMRFQPPRIPLISNVTGAFWEERTAPDAGYWRRHMRQAVRFKDGIDALVERGFDHFIEIGPDPTLIGFGKRCWQGTGRCSWLATLRCGNDDWQPVLQSLGAMYLAGVKVDWERFDGDYSRHRVPLPTYPFERVRCWQDPTHKSAQETARRHPLLEKRMRSALPTAQFETRLGARLLSYLKDHRVHGSCVFPAAGYVETALAASAELFGDKTHSLTDVTLHEALVIPRDQTITLQMVVFPPSSSTAAFQLFSAHEDETKQWKLHASGGIRVDSTPPEPTPETGLPTQIRARCREEASGPELYQFLGQKGLEYGPTFQGVTRLWRRDGEALGEVRLSLPQPEKNYLFHPMLLDSCFHVLAAAAPSGDASLKRDALYLPAGFRSFRLFAPVPPEILSHCVFHENGASGESVLADVRLMDANGTLIGEVRDLKLVMLRREAARHNPADWLYEVEWTAKPLSAAPYVPAPTQKKSWAIVSDTHGFGEAVAERIRAEGGKCSVFSTDEISRLATEGDWDGVIHLASLDQPTGVMTSDTLRQAQKTGCISILRTIQALSRIPFPQRPRLWLVTRGAQPVGSGPLAIAQSAVWGMGRVIDLEHPELACTRIDLEPGAGANEAELLMQELRARERSAEVAFRDKKRFVPLLVARKNETAKDLTLHFPDGPSFQLQARRPENVENLTVAAVERRAPGPDEVEIEVLAAGLNFRDVMSVMGLYPGGPIPLGAECAGRVMRAGSNVTGIAAGDEVIAIASGCFAAFVTTSAETVAAKPQGLSFEEAATIPITFLTACYGLHYLARLSRGEKVLIHAAAGGVGLAAVQLAQAAGAEIFATAGTPDKRAFLQSLGVQHVMDSRTLDFADEIMRLTGGSGVDVVLNSLSGEFAATSLGVLGAHGRFVEIGKTDIYQNRPMGLFPFHNNLSYHAVDLERVCRDRPALVRALFAELLEQFKAGTLRPLPKQVFPIRDAIAGFRYMARRKNIGKVIFSLADAGGAAQSRAGIRADATYLITGGLGGIGLATAQWMVGQGARHLALLSRNAVQDVPALKELRNAGAVVQVFAADVSRETELAQVLSQIRRQMPPLRGVIHAAGVLEDYFLQNLDEEKFARVTEPKIQGAWNLHALTAGQPLDLFVLFSSVASVLGSPGQGSYSAANAFLDALAHHRGRQGLPSLSINWGPWEGVGMAARSGQLGKGALRVFHAMEPEQGFTIFSELLRGAPSQVAVLPVIWEEFFKSLAGHEPPALLADLLCQKGASVSAGQIAGGIAQLPVEALLVLEPERRHEALVSYMQKGMAQIIGSDPAELDPDEPLINFGLDSLMGIELQHALESGLNRKLPVDILIGASTLNELVRRLLEVIAPPGVAGSNSRQSRAVTQAEQARAGQNRLQSQRASRQARITAAGNRAASD
jgi:acyl transferase domain-containing protein/acyl-CoA synthetase (AMP-forming)/AMP-acid ligase II/aryl carrier-like protein